MTDINLQLTEANRLRETQQLDAAETLYQAILQAQPQHLAAAMWQGYIYRQRGQRDKALAQFRVVEQNHPVELWTKLAIVEELRDSKEFTSAMQILNTLAEKQPENFEIIFHKGHIYRQQNNGEQALIHFQQAAQLNPEHLWAHLELAVEYRDKGHFEQALITLTHFSENKPENFHIFLHKGYIYRRQNDYEHALINFNKALSLNPNNLQAHLEIAIVLRDKKNFVQSLL